MKKETSTTTETTATTPEKQLEELGNKFIQDYKRFSSDLINNLKEQQKILGFIDASEYEELKDKAILYDEYEKLTGISIIDQILVLAESLSKVSSKE